MTNIHEIRFIEEPVIHLLNPAAPKTLCDRYLNRPHTLDIDREAQAYFHCVACQEIAEAMNKDTVVFGE